MPTDITKLRGSLVALVTPMRAGVGAQTPLDWEALDALVQFHIAQGTDGIVAVGTTGESATLNEEEHIAVIRRVIEVAAGRIPVIAGTGANSTTEAIRLTRAAHEAGADACLLVTPYYNKPTQEGLFLHHAAVADAVPIAQILYNVPGRTACDMQPGTIARLAAIGNIVGVKEATGDLARVARLRETCPPQFLLLSGDDATAREFILAGGHGVISVTANVAPRAMHDMCAAALGGRGEQAARMDERLAGLHADLFAEANPIPAKWALERMGLIQAGIRLPLTWLSGQCHDRVRRAMGRAGVEFQSP
ncbi:MAG: 4-hydroxy-tetrahydrodipicolinate synthase [Gammaproteobacteria bacterium]